MTGFESPHDKTNKMACAPIEDSDQPGHQSSLSAQWAAKDPSFLHVDSEDSDKSDWVDTQTDLSLCWAHMPFCWFCLEAAHLFLLR